MAAQQLPLNEAPGTAPAAPEATLDESTQSMDRDHSWTKCLFMALCISLCITVDILQYSMPLAFLPSVLEDRGHRPMAIATAIGVYYWTGFAGGLIITSYMVYKMVTARDEDSDEGMEDQVRSVKVIRKNLRYLVYGLGVGSVTLAGQAMYPSCWVHTVCRCAQGMAGAVIFFYAFLLSASMFTGKQQVIAMTMASMALNVAEVMGSAFGAMIFDAFGQGAVFWTLGIISMINQVLVLIVMRMVTGTSDKVPELPETPWPESTPVSERILKKGVRKLKRAMTRPRTVCSVVLITTAGMVKASMEEVLPFHADHRWGLDPLAIGNLFSCVALAYILSAMVASQVWIHTEGCHVCLSAISLVMLGVSAWCVLLTASVYKHEGLLVTNLVLYGVALGFTQTPAALLLAEVVDEETGRAKDAINGVWNTMWEFGGSLGFLLGGLLAENYASQILLFASYTLVCALAACCMLSVSAVSCDMFSGRCALKEAPEKEPLKPWEPKYGGTSTAA
mmetsp:Transcript_2101/g.6182  ORF Transcript_2101/g.6182 Transcript_2101/m.6182 type:complete len:506 (+) Transcript_2101:105-1622(+)